MTALLTTDLPGLSLFRRGKVRDVYDLGEHLLIVSTDRISAFDVVMPNGIPGKGAILTAMSAFWFDFLKADTKSHFVTSDIEKMPKEVRRHAGVLRDRSMLVRKVKIYPIECIVRGYISGSAWKEYTETKQVCGIKLPSGLRESEKLPEPLFTPSTKAEVGHDENISFDRMKQIVGADIAKKLRDLSLTVYKKAAEYALSKGIIIADTKFEWGHIDGEIVLADEVLTPDSSRFWPREDYAPGRSQASFDKQFLRDYLVSTGWDKNPPAPQLPEDIVAKTAERYREAYRRLTGRANLPGSVTS